MTQMQSQVSTDSADKLNERPDLKGASGGWVSVLNADENNEFHVDIFAKRRSHCRADPSCPYDVTLTLDGSRVD